MIYIVYAHPNPESFNRAVLESVKQGLRGAGQDFTVSDLYGEGFNPVLDKEDLALNAKGDAKPEIKPYQEKVAAASGLAFVFPVWWFGPPAILKGFFDRVFSRGFAYEPGPSGYKPLLAGKKALIISTAGGMEEMYESAGFREAMNRVIVTGTLQFCGIWQVKYKIFHNVVDCGEETRKAYLKEAEDLARDFFK